MNLNNLQSSHGIQYNIRFCRFFQFSHRKILTCLQHSENDTKDNDIFPLLKCARFTIRPPLPFTRISHLLLLLQFFPLFSTYNVFHWYPQFLNKFSQFSLEICPKACKIKTRGCCAAMVGDITFPNAGTVLCYFEALLIGIILPQLEGHFKH